MSEPAANPQKPALEWAVAVTTPEGTLVRVAEVADREHARFIKRAYEEQGNDAISYKVEVPF